jgi:hypothetical protein
VQVYAALRAWLAELVPTWRVTRTTNLALLASAILSRRSLCLSELARAYPGGSSHAVRKKRLWRFLENRALDLGALRRQLTYLALHTLRVPVDGGLPLLVDSTYWLPYGVLAAAVPRAGRALPLHWRAYRRDLVGEPERSQHHLEVRFLAECLERVPVEYQPIVVGDRAFGRASLCHWLHAHGWHYVLRVTADVWLHHPTYTGLARALPLRPGQRRWLPGVRYRQDGVVTVNLLAVWRRGCAEPWLLVTNLSDPAWVERLYRRRMQIEHGFRDWKHHLQLRLPASRLVHSARRFGRLITGVVLAYWFTCLVGLRALPRRYARQVLSWGSASVFFLAREFLRVPPQDAPARLARLLDWVARVLAPSRPGLPAWRLRYRRFRPRYT